MSDNFCRIQQLYCLHGNVFIWVDQWQDRYRNTSWKAEAVYFLLWNLHGALFKNSHSKNLQEQVRAHTGDLRRMILKAIQVHVHHKFINLIPSRAQSSQKQAGLADPRSPLWKSIKSQWLCLKEYQWVPYPLINHHCPYVKLSLS